MDIKLDWHIQERGKTLAYKEEGKEPIILDKEATRRAIQGEITRLNEDLNRHFKLQRVIEKTLGRVSSKGQEY